MKLKTAPESSKIRVVRKMLFTNRTRPFPESRFMASRIRVLPFRLIFLPMATMIPAPTAVTPSPPIWISAPSTNWPKAVKLSPASMATRPVTQTALVDVYRESIYRTVTPSFTLQGSTRRMEPIKITSAKPMAMIRPGGCFLIKFIKVAKILF